MPAHSENGEGRSESNKIFDSGSTRALNRGACIAQFQRGEWWHYREQENVRASNLSNIDRGR
jgi:hypothetical protein